MTSWESLRHPTRRGFLSLGLAGALARFFKQGTSARFGAPSVTPSYILSGGASADGILVHSVLSTADVGASVDLAVSRADGTGQTQLVGLRTADGDAIVRHTVSGKNPDTAFVGQLVASGVKVGEPIRFKTLPAKDASWVRRIAVVSCQSNQAQPLNTDLAWRDVNAWQPHDIWHLGDFGYWGELIGGGDSYTKDLFRYRNALRLLPMMRKTIEQASLNVVTISDHELSANGDPPGGIHNSPESIRELVAFQKLFPVREYGDHRSPRRGRYYTFDIGSAVRVIVTDFRSPDRSNIKGPDGPHKTMFGATQLDWIFDTLDPNKVNLLVNETAWLADPNDKPGGRRTDKPWTYYVEQQKIANFVTGGGYKVAWIGGDRHYVGYLRGHDDGSGVHNTLGGWPCYISSGMSKNQLPLNPGELMTWQFGAGPDVEKWVCGYLRLTLSYDDPTRKVTLRAQGRAVLDTSQPKGDWVIRDIPGGSAQDTWTI